MEITSFGFAAFVVGVALGHYPLPGRWQLRWLLIASYVFYWTWDWSFPALLFSLTAANYLLAFRVRQHERPSRAWLAAAIVLNLAVLAGLKYSAVWTAAHPLLFPIGLSFYALQAISYLIDVARGQLARETDFVAFALYLAYFPKLLAGPIERARTFLPQLRRERVLDDERLARATALIVIGLVRKIVIADSLVGMIPREVFAHPARATGLGVWLCTYAIALYNDFAGYTSLVRGVSSLFGIDLSPNFATPFFSRSFTEFWNRWHMTLSHWLRDYIYFPLSRALLRRNLSRTNIANLVLPPMAAMLVCGVWHGTGWGFVLWGAMHGSYLIGERLLSFSRPTTPPQQRPWWRQAIAMAIVFGLNALTLIPFRLSPPVAVEFTRLLASRRVWMVPHARLVAVLALAVAIDWVQVRHDDELAFLRWPRLVRAGLLAAALLVTWLATLSDTGAPFVYQEF